MNKVYLVGTIIEMSEYNFFYNSKKHDSKISFKIKTLNSNYNKHTIIEVSGYDSLADKIYRFLKNGDLIYIEGYIGKNMEVEIKKIAFVY